MPLRFLSIILFMLTLPLYSCGGEDNGGKREKASAPVTVAEVQLRDLANRLTVVGNVAASATVSIKARVTGELVKVHFKEGDHVNEGQLLFSIDPRPFEAALREAQGRLARDKAQLVKAEEDMKRYGRLVGDGYISREAYDKAATDALALRATVRSDEAAVESAALQVAYCTIKSPISGRAGAIQSDRGNMIKANDDQGMLVIDSLEPIYVNFSAPEGYLPAIQEKMAQGPMNVTAIPTGGKPVDGLLTFIDNSVDTRTGTIKLRATFENKDSSLWPGQFVQAVLTLGMVNGAVSVPAKAVLSGRNEYYVYVITSDSKAEYRQVKTIMDSDGYTAIAEGLKPGEKVAVDGQVRLAPGVAVEVRKQ